MTHQPPDPLRRRRRYVLEPLLDNSQLRDELTDAQAQRLLAWARDFVEDAVWQTAVLPDDEAENVLDEVGTAVSRVMRLVNNLTATLSTLDDDSARQQLQALFDSRQRLTGQPPAPGLLEQLVYFRTSWDNETAFDQLMQLITSEQEEE